MHHPKGFQPVAQPASRSALHARGHRIRTSTFMTELCLLGASKLARLSAVFSPSNANGSYVFITGGHEYWRPLTGVLGMSPRPCRSHVLNDCDHSLAFLWRFVCNDGAGLRKLPCTAARAVSFVHRRCHLEEATQRIASIIGMLVGTVEAVHHAY